jgi:hypothetical protein
VAINPMIEERNKKIANKNLLLPELFWAMLEKMYH